MLVLVSHSVSASSLEQQRQWFVQAKQALNAGDSTTYQKLNARLNDYPLQPYLDIWQTRKSLAQHSNEAIGQIIAKHQEIPESEDLQMAWFKHLVKSHQWEKAASLWRSSERTQRLMPNTGIRVLWESGQKALAFSLFSERWSAGETISSKLDDISKAWVKADHPTRMELENRIVRLARYGKWSRIQPLKKTLSRAQRHELSLWQSMQKNPATYLKDWSMLGLDGWIQQPLLDDVLHRLARKDAAQAWQLLQSMQQHIQADHFARLEREIALKGARAHVAESSQWLAELPETVKDDQTWDWQLRMLLMQQQWPELLEAMNQIPELLQQSRWQFWQAYAWDESGETDRAIKIYETLATQRGYYSFLAAERIGRPYSFNNRTFEVRDTNELLQQTPALIRAKEWLVLGEPMKAAREWYAGLAGADESTWLKAMNLAEQWQWHDQAIRAAWKGGAEDALVNRFPLIYQQEVALAAEKSGLQNTLIWSVIRQESAFNAMARSPVGARGLMQLMPKTARQVARKHHMKFSRFLLDQPDHNVLWGSLYLSDMLKEFDDNLAMALAAYNAGPYRVNQWNKRIDVRDATVWVELIPFAETRRYVQQIMAFMSVYEWRQQQVPSSLLARLQFSDES